MWSIYRVSISQVRVKCYSVGKIIQDWEKQKQGHKRTNFEQKASNKDSRRLIRAETKCHVHVEWFHLGHLMWRLGWRCLEVLVKFNWCVFWMNNDSFYLFNFLINIAISEITVKWNIINGSWCNNIIWTLS